MNYKFKWETVRSLYNPILFPWTKYLNLYQDLEQLNLSKTLIITSIPKINLMI